MPGKAVVKPLLREGATGSDKAFLAVAAFLFDSVEVGQFWKDQPLLLGLIDRDAVSKIKHCVSFPLTDAARPPSPLMA
jgi:hypothetical protein